MQRSKVTNKFAAQPIKCLVELSTFYESMNGILPKSVSTFIDGKGDTDIIAKYSQRETEKFEDRKARCFFVPIEEIQANSYDLSVSKYKEIEYEEVKYEEPDVIKKKILELEEKIIKTLQELPSFETAKQ